MHGHWHVQMIEYNVPKFFVECAHAKPLKSSCIRIKRIRQGNIRNQVRGGPIYNARDTIGPTAADLMIDMIDNLTCQLLSITYTR